MSHNRNLGQAGEDAAVAHLEQCGYAVIDRNVRMPHGEIDIVARQGGDLVFIEVKTRSGSGFGTPAEAITPTKMRHMAAAARDYLGANLLTDENARCDVVAVGLTADEKLEVEIIPNALELGALLDT